MQDLHTKRGRFLSDMATITKLPSERWRVQIRRSGHGRLDRVFDTKEAAEEWAANQESRLLEHRAKVVAEGGGKGPTFEELWEGYQRSPRWRDKAEGTQRREKTAAKAVLRRLGALAAENITDDVVQRYVDDRCTDSSKHADQVSGDTVRLERALISAVFKFARRRGLVRHNPARGDIEMPSTKRREIRISLEEEMRLYEAASAYTLKRRANATLEPWLWFVFGTGMRPGEAAKIRLAWVSMEQREIHVPRQGQKNRRPRIVLINDTVHDIVKRQIQLATERRSPYLFWSWSPKYKKFVPYRYAKPWRAICRNANLPESVVPHGVRHEFISRLVERSSMSDSQIAALVGDVHPLSLEPYKHLRAGILRPQLDEVSKVIEELRDKAQAKLDRA